jgi:DNA polymerase-3 subunit delta'
MDDIILHEITLGHLERFIASPVHAVLLSGPEGIGKTRVAQYLLGQLLGVRPAALLNYPQYRFVSPAGSSISIDVIRDLQKFLQLKTIGDRPLRRAVLIEHAGRLTTEAQNAYLKILEEPPADTVLVLTAHTPRALLPTILSRTQSITIYPPLEAQLQAYIQSFGKGSEAERQAYFLSGGLPGLLHALLSGDEQHPLLASVTQAKELLQKTPFERLALVDALSKQKENARLVVEALGRIAEAMLAQAAGKHDAARVRQWHRIRKVSLRAADDLDRSVNAKLALSNLFLQF